MSKKKSNKIRKKVFIYKNKESVAKCKLIRLDSKAKPSQPLLRYWDDINPKANTSDTDLKNLKGILDIIINKDFEFSEEEKKMIKSLYEESINKLFKYIKSLDDNTQKKD